MDEQMQGGNIIHISYLDNEKIQTLPGFPARGQQQHPSHLQVIGEISNIIVKQ